MIGSEAAVIIDYLAIEFLYNRTCKPQAVRANRTQRDHPTTGIVFVTFLGVEIITTVEPGVARTMIEDYASEHDIGLIVLGSRGASDMTEKFLGTVAKYVVNEAPADVFVAPRCPPRVLIGCVLDGRTD